MYEVPNLIEKNVLGFFFFVSQKQKSQILSSYTRKQSRKKNYCYLFPIHGAKHLNTMGKLVDPYVFFSFCINKATVPLRNVQTQPSSTIKRIYTRDVRSL